MTTYQLLQMLPERREAGRGVEELLEGIGPDVAYVRCTSRLRTHSPAVRADGLAWLDWRETETRAGRLQAILEWVQIGVVSAEEANAMLEALS